MAGADSQAGDADCVPGTWSYLWFARVRECLSWFSIVGATVTVHQFFCILLIIISAHGQHMGSSVDRICPIALNLFIISDHGLSMGSTDC